MIILRCFSMTDQLTEKLDSDRVQDYEVVEKPSTSDISILPRSGGMKIYIPLDLEYSQYDLDSKIRELSSFVRTKTILDRNIYIMTLQGNLTQPQLIKLIKYIIEEEGFCCIIEGE